VVRLKFSGSKSDRGQRLRVIKIHNTPSFRGEVNLSAPLRKILRFIKKVLWSVKEIPLKTKVIISFAIFSCFAARWLLVGLPESFCGRIRSFPCRYHSTKVLHAYISRGGWTINPLMVEVQRRSHTPSTWLLTTQFYIWFSHFIFAKSVLLMEKSRK
jgi:hypothetical protein